MSISIIGGHDGLTGYRERYFDDISDEVGEGE
jgi:hypothetical protein